MDSASPFEDEILALNPEHDLIFSKFNEACSRQSPPPCDLRRCYSPNKMKIITKMNQIIGHKQIGELPTHSDWDEHDSNETETIALMRKLGLGKSVDRPPNESRTISTIPTNDDVIIMRNGHKKMSIFMSDSFFELKPRSEPTFCTDDKSSLPDESIASTSDATNLSSKTSSETMSSSASDVSCKVAPESNVPYKNVSSSNSTDSSKTQSDLSWRRRSPTSSGSSSSNRRGNSNYGKRQQKNSNKLWDKNRRASTESSNTNWRASSSKPAEVVKPKPKQKTEQQVNVEEVVKNTKVEPKIKPKAISNCGSPLYKPKDLVLLKKAMRIKEVLGAHQP